MRPVWPVDLGYVLLDEGDCNGRDEICTFNEAPCNAANSVKECADLCTADVSCISFEQHVSGKCQLSKTCTAFTKDQFQRNGWWIYVKSGQNCGTLHICVYLGVCGCVCACMHVCQRCVHTCLCTCLCVHMPLCLYQWLIGDDGVTEQLSQNWMQKTTALQTSSRRPSRRSLRRELSPSMCFPTTSSRVLRAPTCAASLV